MKTNSHMMARIADVYCRDGVKAAMKEMDNFFPVAAMDARDYAAYLDMREAVMYAMYAMGIKVAGGKIE